MQTLRTAMRLLLAASILLSSCKNKQKDPVDTSKNQAESISQDSQACEPEMMNISGYAATYCKSMTQEFIVPCRNETTITGRKGLKLTVDPSKLETKNGAPLNGNIRVKLIEVTNTEDLFRTDAATVSDGRLLVSGGSYFIGMECNGAELKLKTGRSLEVQFPLISKDAMELFYGERDESGNMNWKRAAVLLSPQRETISFTDSNPWDAPEMAPDPWLEEMAAARVYRSLEEPVYYYEHKMTLGQLVDSINSRSVKPKVFLQTISYWPKNIPTDKGPIDTNYLVSRYGPRLQYILRRYKDEEDEANRLEKWKNYRDSVVRNWKPKSLAGQLKQYYATAEVGTLGWLNCDRFADPQKQTEVEFDFPITYNKSRMQYFILYKSFKGFLRGQVDADEDGNFVLANMPAGESALLIGFTKVDGVIYQYKQEFTVERNKKINGEFKSVSAEELKNIFGKNVQI